MLVGQTVGQFLIEKELGSGAMGSVYRAQYVGEDARLIRELGEKKRVALKVIAFGLANNDMALARFDREAKILKQLRHPNIVRLYGNGRYRDTPFFVMEYCDGQSMDRILARRDRFSWEEVIEYGKQLSAALQHAHEKGIIHRDLKPSNLMVTRDSVMKLTDFGIAKDVDVTALTGANNTIGTAAYMSPEQCKGEKHLTAKSDLYSLGIVFYELLTGVKPFQAESSVDMFMLHVQGSFIRPSKLVPNIPIWLDTLVCQLMEKKPEHRPIDAAMVGRALDEVAEKVTTQKSIGAEIANARAGDRIHLTGQLDEADMVAGKTIKAGLKKKRIRKKGMPIYRRGWFTIAASICFVALFGFVIYSLLRPESAESMAERIEKTTKPESRRQLIKEYLIRYGDQKNERSDKIRDFYREEHVKELETIFVKRTQSPLFAGKLREDPESWNKDAYRLTISAIDLEGEGNLTAAKQTWKELNDTYSSDPTEKIAELGWLGAKRARDIEEMNGKEVELRKRIEKDDVNETDRKFDSSFEGDSSLALRCEILTDWLSARDRWKRIKEDLAKKPEHRVWFLLAAYHQREIEGRKDQLNADNREILLKSILEKAILEATGEENPVRKRDGRNLLRDLRDLYANDIESLRKMAEKAKEVLLKLPR